MELVDLDADRDNPLNFSCWPNTNSGIILPGADPNLIFADDFESGDTSAWESVEP